MERKLTFSRENLERVKAVVDSFGPAGKSLNKPGRILIGEGRLLKQSRKKPQPKVFFLFNDVMVYGSIVVKGRWYKNQKIIPLENIKLQDIEDTASRKNQWLIQTPQKSFYVAAATPEEKHQWMRSIEEYKSTLVVQGLTDTNEYAASWIPDSASNKCMICESKFTPINRRHHCRRCGILVCDKCCKKTMIGHISASQKQKVCTGCYSNKQEEVPRSRGHSEEDQAESSDDDDDNEQEVDDSLYQTPSSWLDSRMGTWSDIGAYMTMHPTKT